MVDDKIILPLELALRRAYTERRLKFPDRTEKRLILEYPKHREWFASYSTTEYPVISGQSSGEVLRLCRKIETTSDKKRWFEQYLGLVYDTESKAKLVITCPEFEADMTDKGEEQISQIAEIAPLVLQATERIEEAKGYVNQDLLLELARDYMAMVTVAREKFIPVINNIRVKR